MLSRLAFSETLGLLSIGCTACFILLYSFVSTQPYELDPCPPFVLTPYGIGLK